MAAELVICRDLGDIRDAWDDLVVTRTATPAPDARSWWVEGLGSEHTHFVLVFEGDRLHGGVRLDLWAERGVTYLRSPPFGVLPPETRLFVAAGSERVVLTRLDSWLRSYGSMDVDVDGVVATSPLLDTILGTFPRRAGRAFGAPYIVLPPDFGDFIRSRQKRTRIDIEHLEMSARQAEYRCSVVQSQEIDLYVERLSGSIDPEHGTVRCDVRSLQVGASQNELTLIEATYEGRVVALDAILSAGDRSELLTLFRANALPTFRRFHTLLLLKALQQCSTASTTHVGLGAYDSPSVMDYATGIAGMVRVKSAYGRRVERRELAGRTKRRLRSSAGRARRLARRVRTRPRA